MCKVSVVIPAHNAGKFIATAIESVLYQGVADSEVLVIDDGSEDDTKDAVLAYAHHTAPQVRYVAQRNAGVSAARNRGMTLARGDCIALLDADDLLLPGSLRCRQQLLANHPEVALAFGDFSMKEDRAFHPDMLRSRHFATSFAGIAAQDLHEWLIFDRRFLSKALMFSPFPIWTGTVMLRRSAVQQIGLFRTDMASCEDVDYWIKLLQRFPVGYVDRTLAIYRHDLSTLSLKNLLHHQNLIEILQGLHQTADDPELRRLLRIKLKNMYFALGYLQKQRKEFRQSRSSLMRSIAYDPVQVSAYKTFMSTLLPSWIRRNSGNSSC